MIRMIMQIIMGVVLVGLFIALLRAFDWDIFALVQWIIDFFFSITGAIADGFSNNEFFRNFVKK